MVTAAAAGRQKRLYAKADATPTPDANKHTPSLPSKTKACRSQQNICCSLSHRLIQATLARFFALQLTGHAINSPLSHGQAAPRFIRSTTKKHFRQQQPGKGGGRGGGGSMITYPKRKCLLRPPLRPPATKKATHITHTRTHTQWEKAGETGVSAEVGFAMSNW